MARVSPLVGRCEGSPDRRGEEDLDVGLDDDLGVLGHLDGLVPGSGIGLDVGGHLTLAGHRDGGWAAGVNDLCGDQPRPAPRGGAVPDPIQAVSGSDPELGPSVVRR